MSSVWGQVRKCDHTPGKALVSTPSDQEHTFRLSIDTKQKDNKYLPDQTYVGKLLLSTIFPNISFCFLEEIKLL